jgi:pilus assembly protein Flp/PilA
MGDERTEVTMADALLNIKIWLAASLRLRQGDERGASLVEYALLLALIAMVCFAAVGFVGGEADSMYDGTGSSLGN